MADNPTCTRCAGPSRYKGRISLPPQMIYRCDFCGHEMWMQSSPAGDQPQAQQQQQPQPDLKKADDGGTN